METIIKLINSNQPLLACQPNYTEMGGRHSRLPPCDEPSASKALSLCLPKR